MKKILYLLVTIVIINVLASPHISFAEKNSYPLNSVENYIEFLENYDESDAKLGGVDPEYFDIAVETAHKNAIKLKNMPTKDQTDLLEYMRNPNKLAEVFKNNSDPRFTTINSKPEIETVVQLSNGYRQVKVSHIGNKKYSNGFDIITLGIYGHLEVYGNNIVKIIKNETKLHTNTHPETTLTKEYNTGGLVNGNSEYLGKAAWRVDAYSMTLTVLFLEVRGNYKGTISGRLYE